MSNITEQVPGIGATAANAPPGQAGLPTQPSTNMQRRWSDGAGGDGRSDPRSDSGQAWSMAQQWPSLVATLSEQSVESSNVVLRALDFLVGAGRLRPAEAKALGETLRELRETSLRAQQITRLASGRIRQARDRVEMASVIQGLLDERCAAFEGAGVMVRGVLSPVDVLLDPPVAVTLVNTIIDWAMAFSKDITLRVDTPVWPMAARLVVSVVTPQGAGAEPGKTAGRAAATAAPQAAAGGTRAARAAKAPRDRSGRRINDGLHWMLLRQIALAANLSVVRSGAPGLAVLTVEFPKTFKHADGLSSVELFEDEAHDLARYQDSWVLVVAGDEQLRLEAVEALRLSGVAARAVIGIAQAREAVAQSRPDAMVVSQELPGHEFEVFREQAMGRDRCPVIEITDASPSFHTLGFEGWEVAKVGRKELERELAPAVLFELAKNA
jgi:hypothetical protein